MTARHLHPKDLDGLIERHKPGTALEREFYTDPSIFELDLERLLLRHWFCAGHVSSVPRPGDFLVVDLGPESVVVVRNSDGEIRALVNVCRHRGSRVCTTRTGHAPAGRLTCPYHAWSYDLDGRLIAAREMPQTFERRAFGLKTLAVRVAAGLIFTSFADRPPDFIGAERALAATAGVHGWGSAKIAHRESYAITANWKLAVENYMECYHCQPAHKEFAARHVYARPSAESAAFEAQGRRRAETLGIHIADVDLYADAAAPGGESVSVFRSALSDGVSSPTPDNGPIGRLMGDFAAHDGPWRHLSVHSPRRAAHRNGSDLARARRCRGGPGLRPRAAHVALAHDQSRGQEDRRTQPGGHQFALFRTRALFPAGAVRPPLRRLVSDRDLHGRPGVNGAMIARRAL
jgi:Rieske 2Fe-2S family protein